jgi:hypothetical protein
LVSGLEITDSSWVRNVRTRCRREDISPSRPIISRLFLSGRSSITVYKSLRSFSTLPNSRSRFSQDSSTSVHFG